MQYGLLLSLLLSIFLSKDYLAYICHPQQTEFWGPGDSPQVLNHTPSAMRLLVDSLLRPDSLQVCFYTIHWYQAQGNQKSLFLDRTCICHLFLYKIGRQKHLQQWKWRYEQDHRNNQSISYYHSSRWGRSLPRLSQQGKHVELTRNHKFNKLIKSSIRG